MTVPGCSIRQVLGVELGHELEVPGVAPQPVGPTGEGHGAGADAAHSGHSTCHRPSPRRCCRFPREIELVRRVGGGKGGAAPTENVSQGWSTRCSWSRPNRWPRSCSRRLPAVPRCSIGFRGTGPTRPRYRPNSPRRRSLHRSNRCTTRCRWGRYRLPLRSPSRCRRPRTPVASLPLHAELVAASSTVVSTEVEAEPTEKGSQVLVDPV